jgi:hypothetical protein
MRSRWAGPLLLLVITLCFYWKLIFSGYQFTWLDQPDIVYQVMPWFQAQAVEFHKCRFPLWDPHQWAGQPFIGQVQPGTLNPFNWLLLAWPLQRGFVSMPALHWFFVLIHFMAALFAYRMCRDLRLSRSAAVLAGVIFGLGGFIATIGWTQLMFSAVLLPLILMFLLRVIGGEAALKNAAAAGALLGASFLSGHHNVPTYSTIFFVGLWIYYFAVVRRPRGWRDALPCAAFFACFLLIAAAQILPAYELGKLSVRWVGAREALAWNQRVPYPVHEELSLYPTAVLGIALPGFQRDAAAFIGMVALTMAYIGAIAFWRDRAARILAAFALGSLVFALGAYSLFHGILYALIPGLDKARTPHMALVLCHLGVAGLAAYGLDARRLAPVVFLRVARIAMRALTVLGAALYGALIVLITVRPEKGEEYKFLALAALTALLMAGLLGAWNRAMLSGRTAAALLLLLTLFELNTIGNYGFRRRDLPAFGINKLYQNRDIAEYLKQRTEPVRIEVDANEIPYNFGDWFGVDQIEGYQPGAMRYLAMLQGERRIRMLLATNYYIARDPATPDQRPVFDAASGLKVYQNDNALPRVRTVHEAVGVANEPALTAKLRDVSIDLGRVVALIGSAPALEVCPSGDDVRIESYLPNRVKLRARMGCRGMVILADSWYPGWRAYVDGRPAQIHAAYNLARGVVAERGEHELVFSYQPGSVYLGLACAAIGIALCAFLRLRKERQPQPA